MKKIKSRGSLPASAKVSVKTKAKPVAKPDAPKEHVESSKLIADQIEQSSNNMLVMMASLKEQISEIRIEAAQPPTEWEFEFIRDRNDNLTKIKAKAITQTKRLN